MKAMIRVKNKKRLVYVEKDMLCRHCGGDCFVVCSRCGHCKHDEECPDCYGTNMMNCGQCKGFGRVAKKMPVLEEKCRLQDLIVKTMKQK